MKTDFLYALETILPVKRMRKIVLCITCRCNSRCKTCNIWKKRDYEEPSMSDLKRFADSSIFRKVKFLTLTGGEPFLRKDIDEIVNMFKKRNPKLHITILTNALLPEVIYEKTKKMPRDVVITLSFNGNEKAHDETRGVKGNFKKLLKTIESMKKLGQNMSFIFTVTKENYNQLLWAWEFAKKQNINIMFSPEMEYGRLETEKNRELTESQKKEVLSQLKKIYSERHRPFFDSSYMLFFKKFYSHKTVTNLCYAGTNSLYIDYTGDIYPCENLVGRIPPLGSIKSNFRIQKDYTKKVKDMKCYKNCYLLCEMVPNLRRSPLKVILGK
jgi:MoaA/NifB/PqqE/SkfB family radical SAM enzyme